MSYKAVFEALWNDYVSLTPDAQKVHDLFTQAGETVLNDHIAFRTFDLPGIDVEALARPFLANGYVEKGQYHFESKKLFAKHYEHQTDPSAPRVFISQLLTGQLSPFVQQTAKACAAAIPAHMLQSDELIVAGNIWGKPSYTTYLKLRDESEYAAWLYVYGFRANHFTVNINALKVFDTIEKVNQHLKDNGFLLNTSGGEIKGTREELLQQSSTLAQITPIAFAEGTHEIPSCYYEFAIRYPDTDGKLYSGFIAKSADKIFESTDFYKK